MIRLLLVSVAVSSFSAWGQPPSATFNEACKGSPSVKIAGSTTLFVICNKTWVKERDGVLGGASLFIVPPAAANDPAVPNTLLCATDPPVPEQMVVSPAWRIALKCPLTAGNSYQLRLDWIRVGDKTSTPAKAAFDTKGDVVILDTPESADSGHKLSIEGNSQLQPGMVSIKVLGSKQTIPAKLNPRDPDSRSLIGLAELELTGDGLPPGNYKLQVSGLKGAVGEDMSADPTEKVEISPTRGSAKEDVFFYAKFGHQAGEGSKPAWILDVKSEYELPVRWKHWRLFPMLHADTGFGSAETNDSIKGGFGVRRLISPKFLQRIVQGMTPSASGVYETDRGGGKRNLIADLDVKLFFPGTYAPLARRNRIALVEQMRAENNYKLQMEDLKHPKKVGYTLQAFLGGELGNSLYTQKIEFQETVNGAKVDQALELPSYGILRFRPKVAAALEIMKLTLSASGTARYLGTTEPTPRQLADKTFIRANRRGWLGYGEFAIAYSLNSVVAIDVSYKHGAEPPLFKRVNVVQSGIVYHF